MSTTGNDGGDGRSSTQQKDKSGWRKRLKDVLSQIGFHEVRVRRTEHEANFELQFSQRIPGTKSRFRDRFDFGDDYELWDVERDEPVPPNRLHTPHSQAYGPDFDWQKEWFSTANQNKEHREIWGILKTKTYDHDTMSATRVGDILDSYGCLYRRLLFSSQFVLQELTVCL